MMLIGKPIPGETPIDDISGLKIRGITNREELSVVEAENVRKAVAKYLAKRPTARQAPFNMEWTKKLHKQMFGNVWNWAGTFRLCDLNIGVPWGQVEVQLHDLLQNLAAWGQYGTPILAQAARLHYQSVKIHPFLNGNGRWSRLLANIWLARNGHQLTEWPDESIGQESPIRAEYIAAIKAAADEGDENPLLSLHTRYTPPK